jgi:hypothetical protein
MKQQDIVIDILAKALEDNMKWIGAPPTGKYEYDSQREDAWELGQQALRKYRSYLDGFIKEVLS